MPIVLLVLIAVICLQALVVGVKNIRVWDERNDPDYFRDVVHHGVVAFLKIGLLLLLLTLAVIAVVAALAANRGNTPLPYGAWVCFVLAVLISLGFIGAWWRRRSER